MERIHWAMRIVIGCLGGLLSVGSKFLAQDFARFQQMLDNGDMLKMRNLAIGYGVACFVIVFIGAGIAWIFEGESNRGKLLMLAVSAPALLTTWAGGAALSPARISFELIPSAYAQAAAEPSAEPSIWDGIRLFFGGEKSHFYRVVVGSYPDQQAAQTAADHFNEIAPGIGARIGGKKPGSNFVSVVVSDYLPYQDAKTRLEEAKKVISVDDAFLSPAP